MIEVALDPEYHRHPGPALAAAVPVVLGAVLAAFRPVLGTWIVAATFPVAAIAGTNGPTGAGLIAFFLAPGWAGYQRPPSRSWLAPFGSQLLASAGIAVVHLVHSPGGNDAQSTVWENLFFSFLCWASWGVGLVARRLRERSEQLARLAAILDAEREARDRAVVVEERQRIAREVHDSVAHSVSVMVLQLGALRTTLEPGSQVAVTLASVERLGRAAVAELRGLVGILRDVEPSPSIAPPSLERAEELVAEVRAAGLPAQLCRIGEPSPLPRALDVSAYRILQEALTNVLRHAGPVPTTVTVAHSPDAVTVEVVDSGAAGPGVSASLDSGSGGHGLVGMRERVAVYGGSLRAGPCPSGGFEVQARFPLAGSS